MRAPGYLRACFAAGLWMAGACRLFGAETNGPPDCWLTNQVQYPRDTQAAQVSSNRFASLRAELLAEALRVVWTPPPGDTATGVVLRSSVDEPGHWPARDWRSLSLERRGGGQWEAVVPVDTPDVPLVYFAAAAGGGPAAASPMRLCLPRRLGLEAPTRIFWPFLEGFEEGFESWRWVAGVPEDEPFRTAIPVKNGKAALSVTLGPGRSAATLGTTRVRGWRVLERGATGVALWMRMREGAGRARFTLLANAFATNQVVAPRPGEVTLGQTWQRVELPFKDFGRLPLADLDFFAIELLGRPGAEFLLDDLQLLGHWLFH